MSEIAGEIQLPIDTDELDVPVPPVDPEIPAHIELELVKDAVEDREDKFIADAQARLDLVGQPDIPTRAADHPDNLPVYTPPERDAYEKEVARDAIRSIGQAIGRERSRQRENSITARRLGY